MKTKCLSLLVALVIICCASAVLFTSTADAKSKPKKYLLTTSAGEKVYEVETAIFEGGKYMNRAVYKTTDGLYIEFGSNGCTIHNGYRRSEAIASYTDASMELVE